MSEGQRGRGTVSTVGCTPQSASTRKLTLSNNCEPGLMPGSLFLYQPCGQLRFLAVLVKPMHDCFNVAVTTAVADGMKCDKKERLRNRNGYAALSSILKSFYTRNYVLSSAISNNWNHFPWLIAACAAIIKRRILG